ncbi:MAG: hypothetical protein IJH04_07250, partial [Eggerthellaceae bacterium]|nr:hypothetical protein [Eggerthellaceae bacterium]
DYLYSDDPNDNSAYTFEEFWYLCDTLSADTNDPLAWTYFTLGDKIKMVCNTTAFSDTTIILQLEAFKHFKTADAAGWTNTVWGMVGIMNAQKAINSGNVNTGGYPASTVMRPWLNTTVYTNLPLHWQAVITQAQVLSSKGGQSSDIVSSSDYLFLRSYTEVQFGSAVPYGNEIADGADSKTFGFYTSNTARTKKSYNGTGTAAIWWLRSPNASNTTYFQNEYNGGSRYNNDASDAYGVSFCFCIGSKLIAA